MNSARYIIHMVLAFLTPFAWLIMAWSVHKDKDMDLTNKRLLTCLLLFMSVGVPMVPFSLFAGGNYNRSTYQPTEVREWRPDVQP